MGTAVEEADEFLCRWRTIHWPVTVQSKRASRQPFARGPLRDANGASCRNSPSTPALRNRSCHHHMVNLRVPHCPTRSRACSLVSHASTNSASYVRFCPLAGVFRLAVSFLPNPPALRGRALEMKCLSVDLYCNGAFLLSVVALRYAISAAEIFPVSLRAWLSCTHIAGSSTFRLSSST